MYPGIENIEIPCEMELIQEVKLKFHLIDTLETKEND
jgi:hypothetical protein